MEYISPVHNAAANYDVEQDPSLAEKILFSAEGVAASFAANTLNVGVGVYNMLTPESANIEELSATRLLRSMDGDAAAAFYEDTPLLEVGGFAASAILPGMLGVKALRLAQSGKYVPARISRILNLPETKLAEGRAALLEGAKTGEATMTAMSADFGKAVAGGMGSIALDAFAFEVASNVALQNSPILHDMTAKDLAENIAYNTMFGAGLGALGSGIKTYYKTYSAMASRDAATFASRDIKMPEATPDVNIGELLKQKNVAAELIAKGDPQASIINNKIAKIDSILVQEVKKIAPAEDFKLQLGVAGALSRATGSAMWETPLGLKGVKRIVDAKEEIGAAATKSQATPAYQVMELATGKSIDMEDAVYHIGDYLPAQSRVVLDSRSGSVIATTGKTAKVLATPAVDKKIAEMTDEEVQASWLRASLSPVRTSIHINDIPAMEAAITNFPAKGGIMLRTEDGAFLPFDDPAILRSLTLDAKIAEANRLKLAGASDEYVAQRLNTSVEWVNDPHGQPMSAVAVGKEMEDYITAPKHAAMLYEKPKDLVGKVSEAQAQAYRTSVIEAVNSERERLSEVMMAEIGIDKRTAELPTLQEMLDRVTDASRASSNAGMFSAANADLGSLGSFSQRVGTFVAEATPKMVEKAETKLNPSMLAIRNDENAAMSFILTREQLALSKHHYVIGESISPEYTGKFVREDIAVMLKKPKQSQAAMDMLRIEKDAAITPHEHVYAHYKDSAELNATYRKVGSGLHAGAGYSDVTIAEQHGLMRLYNIPKDTRKYKFFSLVSMESSTALGTTSHKQIITSSTAAGLQAKKALIEKAVQKGEIAPVRFYDKGDTAEYYKALGEYEYARGLNENIVDSSLRRVGVLGEEMPNVSPNKLQEIITDQFDDVMNFHRRMSARTIRDIVEHKYAPVVQELQKLGETYSSTARSTFSAGGRDATSFAINAADNPYAATIKTMLNISRKEEYSIWHNANEWVERTGSSAFAAVKNIIGTAKLSPKNLDEYAAKLNEVAEKQGLVKRWDAEKLMDMAEIPVAERRVMTRAIVRAQGLASSLMLGLDPIQHMNNAIGQIVLQGEVRQLIKDIIAKNPAKAGALGMIKVPGTQLEHLAPAKLQAKAIGRFFSGGDAWDSQLGAMRHHTGEELLARYMNSGAIIDANLKNFRRLLDEGSLVSAQGGQKLLNKTEDVLSKAQSLLGANHFEKFSRFIAADVAGQLTDIARSQGVKMSDGAASAYWLTLANRAQGNLVASQRPVAFQGPIGQAVGMFMTYYTNMLQQLFRHFGEGNKGSMVAVMAAQSALYGLQGLPAFNWINTRLIGNAAGNTEHKDVYSLMSESVDGETFDWLMYGAGSNALGLINPDLKFNLYTRGDINPRQLTIIPTSLDETVLYSATIKSVSNMMDFATNVLGGADFVPSFLHALEHNSINRPLAGLAAVVGGGATTSSGKLLAGTGAPINETMGALLSGDYATAVDKGMYSQMVRIAGGKPLLDASASDAVHRMAAYRAADTANMADLAQEMRLSQQGGDGLSADQLESFMARYVSAGGNAKNFNRFMVKTYKQANISTINTAADTLGSDSGYYLSTLMGGETVRNREVEEQQIGM